MRSRRAAGVFIAVALVLASGERAARSDEPPKPPSTNLAPAPAPPSPASPVTASPAQGQPHGAVVVAASEGAGPAARALAFEVYRDPDLRPSFDDATARVLAGQAAAGDASAELREIAEICVSVAHATSDLVARRLLASLGTELGATLVVSVAMDGSRPVARVLRPATGSFERVELGPTVDIAADGARTYRWPGAAATLRGFLPPSPGPRAPMPPPAPLAPKAEALAAPAAPAPAEARPFYRSPWFWGSVGGAAAVGLSVFLISRATSSAMTDVHLTGKIGP